MKKIMFNDKYGLTRAVLEGRKTQTRRICTENQLKSYNLSLYTPYTKEDVVAVAQNYKNAGLPETIAKFGLTTHLSSEAGWTNKMFVRADLMPHRIKITNVNIGRLQDISDEDCIKEGIKLHRCADGYELYSFEDLEGTNFYRTAIMAYAALIDRTSGKGTWKANPYVFVYDFELIK